MKILDDFLIDRIFEKFSHKFQVATGKTCYYLAKICHILVAATISCLCIMYVQDPHNLISQKIGSILLCIAVIVQEMYWSNKYDNKDREHLDSKEKTMNSARLELRRFRLIFVGLFLIVGWFYIPAIKTLYIKDYLVWISILLQVIYLYFHSCTPLPPCTSKILSKLKVASSKIQNFLFPKPEEIPSEK